MRIQHWRDDELFEEFDLDASQAKPTHGLSKFVFPPGHVEFATGDELRFDALELKVWVEELLRG